VKLPRVQKPSASVYRSRTLDTRGQDEYVSQMAHDIILSVPDESELGPAMKAITVMERAFVYAIVECGGNSTNAAGAAGYCANDTDEQSRRRKLNTIGSQKMRSPKIADAIQEEARKRLKTGAFIGVETLLHLANESTSEKIRLQAALALIDRNGMAVTTKHEVEVRDFRSTKEIIERIEALARKRGIDPKMLLGGPEPTDAVFTPVESDAGLEDIF